MTSKTVTADSLRSLWQSMPTEPVVVSLEEMRARSSRFERRIRRRNLVEYIASAIVVVGFGWYATWPSTTLLWPVANLLIVAAALNVGWKLHRHGSARKASAEASVSDLIAFHRAELARQRDGLVTVWRWYVLPFVPGFGLWIAAMWIMRSAEANERATWSAVVLAISFIAVSAIIILLNLLAASRLQRRIEELDRFREKL